MLFESFLFPIIGAILSISVGVVGYIMKNILRRLESLERVQAMTDPQVRQLISDKLDPIKEDLSEIKQKLDYIFDLLFSKHKKF